MSQRNYYVVLNTRSGTANDLGLTPEALRQHFSEAGHEVTVDADTDEPLPDRIERAKASGADVIVAAGGDGTATAIASAIVGTDTILGILPLGTINLLARDLGVPLDINQWMAALDGMEPRRIDVGEANGRIFLHKVVIGFIPGVAAGREKIRGRGELAAKIGLVRYFFRRLLRARRMAVEIQYRNGEAKVERVLAIAVANNDYAEGPGRFFSRDRLDGGSLSLYVLKHLTIRDFFRLTLGMLLGHWRQDDALEIENVGSVTIRTRKSLQKVMLDGEVESFDVPVNFKIRPGALWVLAPAVAEGITAEATMPEAVVGA
ncbi:MAG TPA: diacylglycerol kinase family protein [Arsenicitalea sp.]|jgi:diacylglycerol kinase family enzyme|nr:diacylglycerol kinase family protein [Arsenicitalea sp.]